MEQNRIAYCPECAEKTTHHLELIDTAYPEYGIIWVCDACDKIQNYQPDEAPATDN